MEGGVLDDGHSPRPPGRRLAFGHGLLDPAVGAGVRGRQLVERERLPDAPPELIQNNLELGEQLCVAPAIAGRGFEPPVALLPLVSCRLERRLRPELPGGIGGQTRTGGLKCLHAHAAFALARPGYELGERILAEVEPLWPSQGCCTPH